MKSEKFTLKLGGRDLTIEIRNLAEQANGSVLARYGDTVVLGTAVMAKQAVQLASHAGIVAISQVRRALFQPDVDIDGDTADPGARSARGLGRRGCCALESDSAPAVGRPLAAPEARKTNSLIRLASLSNSRRFRGSFSSSLVLLRYSTTP